MGNHQIKPIFNDRYPDDAVSLILIKVDILTLSSCPRVCRQFARVLRKPYFWRCKLKTREDPRRVIHHLTMTEERKEVVRYALSKVRKNSPRYFEPIYGDSAHFASTISLIVQTRTILILMNVCEECQTTGLIFKDRVTCRTCGHVSDNWDRGKVAVKKYIISKPPDYRFPY